MVTASTKGTPAEVKAVGALAVQVLAKLPPPPLSVIFALD